MELKWSELALADRRAIFDYIETESPHAVISVDQRIDARIKGLVQFPEMGRQGRVAGTRELVVTGTPYVAAYRIIDGTVLILRVLHGARRWPSDMPDRQ